ncbi:MAG: amylo-alpha-1,6-glucosidase, partial [Actinobacteria bacterium]|nr:amylo-alpha-1,6-glucosidase [Actinomycetota bacterium]
ADGPGRTRFVGLARGLGDDVADPTVRVERARRVTPGRLEETFTVRSSATGAVRLALRVEVAGDLVPVEHAKAGLPPRPPAGPAGSQPPAAPGTAALRWGDDAVQVLVSAPGAVADGVRGTLTWVLDVAPDTATDVRLVLAVTDPGAAVVPASTPPWRRPEVTADDRRLPALLAQSLDDLESLRMATASAPGDTFLAAGAPWFLTLFGRDSLWAARMLLPLGTDLALGTLRTLAAYQGVRTDPAAEEEPGKILHELRSGEMARAGEVPYVPYYGTVDATPLWVCLLHDAWRWGLPAGDVEPLLPALVAALDWVGAAATAGGGFLSYVDHSGSGLANQGWKDSGDAVRFDDGALAAPPVALAEVQGYAYEAAVCGADLLDAFGLPGGGRWREFAADLAVRFRERYWVDRADGRYPALALDGAGRVVDAVASNMGHLLGTGILDAGEAADVAARLGAPDMAGGFGLRTMSARAGGFGVMRYHCGTVWPHDTAAAVAGLVRTGHRDVAAGLLGGVLDAAPAFRDRLPELWSGDARDAVPGPVAYPAACRPQAWAAAAPVAMTAALLGLEPDAPAGRLVVRRGAGPLPVGALAVRGLTMAGDRLDVEVDRTGEVRVVAPEGIEVVRA